MRITDLSMYHKECKVCLILGNFKFVGGGWGFGTVVIRNCILFRNFIFVSKTIFFWVQKELFFV